MLLYDSNGLAVRMHVEFGLNAVAEQSLFWDLARATTPSANFDPNKIWVESYIKPGLSWAKRFGSGLTAYGMVSGVASATWGIDAFDTGNTGRTTLEEGYVGLRSDPAKGPYFDVSVGPREFKTGTGMLLANGASSGFERGALKLGPRKAWEFAALGKLGYGGFAATGFYLDPNELRGGSYSRIAGADIRYDRSSDAFAGITIGRVLDSSAPYPRPALGGFGPPTIIRNARRGLSFANAYGRAMPFDGAFKNVFVAADVAYEWNQNVDLRAWGGRVQVGYTFASLPWMPVLTYSYQVLSGDNPSTPTIERFDPLYFEGSPSAWSTGSKSSMVFINSNVAAHQLSLRVTPTEDDTITLRYTYINANRLRSPLQFGQATRVDLSGGDQNVVTGVTKRHLSDDMFIEYTRRLNARTYLTAGFSVSVPGPGITSVVPTRTPAWTGGFVNVVASF